MDWGFYNPTEEAGLNGMIKGFCFHCSPVLNPPKVCRAQTVRVSVSASAGVSAWVQSLKGKFRGKPSMIQYLVGGLKHFYFPLY